VSEPATPFAIRRILVALDASPYSLAALEMAANLAATLEAELAGLFVEDVDLLRMADAPWAREIAYQGEASPTSRTVMERKLRAQSDQIRSILAEAAERAQVRWSFRTVRGEVASALLAAASQHDIVAMGRLGWSFARRPRIGSTALELAASSIPLLLISQRAALQNLFLLVYYDSSAAARNALEVAAKVAKSGAKAITVLVAASDFENRVSEIRRLLHGQGLEVRFKPIDLDEEMSLSRAVKEEGAVLLVLAGRQLLKDRDAFEALLRQVEVPLLVLGDGFGGREVEPPRRAVG